MPALPRSRVTLRVVGKDLKPDDISRRLGATPTSARLRGSARRFDGSAEPHVPPFGSWHLETSECRPEDVNGQVDAILAGLTTDLTVGVNRCSVQSRHVLRSVHG